MSSQNSFHVRYSSTHHPYDYLRYNNPRKVIKTVHMSTSPSSPVQSVLFPLAIFSFLTNLLVVYIVLNKPARLQRERTATVLVTHLAGISICLAFTSMLDTGDGIYFISVARDLCSFVAYWKNVYSTAFSLNIVMFIYERIQSFREIREKFMAVRLILIIWLVSISTSFPAAAMSKSRGESSNPIIVKVDNEQSSRGYLGNCQMATPFLGSTSATILYEIFRYLLFFMGVGIYLFYAVLKIRARYLHSVTITPGGNWSLKMATLYVTYFHFLSFLLLWTPLGTFLFFRRVNDSIQKFDPDENLRNPNDIYYQGIFFLCTYLYLISCPLVSLLLLENRAIQWLYKKSRCRRRTNGDCVQVDLPVQTVGNREMRPTTGLSVDENDICKNLPRNNSSFSTLVLSPGDEQDIGTRYWPRSFSEEGEMPYEKKMEIEKKTKAEEECPFKYNVSFSECTCKKEILI